MRDPLTQQQFARIAVVTFLAFATIVAVIHSRRDEEVGVLAPPEHEQVDALTSELARCRIITPDQTVALESCRRIWAENRRQFFRPTRTLKSGEPASTAAATDSGKSQDRIAPNYQQREVR